jgi:hypothetical protein
MNKNLFTYLTIAILITLSAFAGASAQTPKTVTDFYLAMPDEKFIYDEESRKLKGKAALTKYRRSLIKIEDVKNGYLRLEPTFLEGWVEIALFKKNDGSYLVAQTEVGCGPGCDGSLEFFTYKSGQWTNVTEDFLPPLPYTLRTSDLENYWKLPRAGKTLIFVNTNEDVREESEKLVKNELKFDWNGKEFVEKR